MRAIATETRSIIYDLSPGTIVDVYQSKTDGEKMIAMVMMSAKKY